MVTTDAPGTTVAPLLADCACTETVHEPAPPPASESEIRRDLTAPPPLASMKPKDSEDGLANSFGVFAAMTFTRPAPSRSTGASRVRAVSAQAGPALVI